MEAAERLRNLLDRLSGVRPSGSGHGWEARCPAHDDDRQSLSVGMGAMGKILLKCHAGCRTEAVVSAVGLSMQDLFSSNGEANGFFNIQEVYDYVDESGNLLFQVCRLIPKSFRQRRPAKAGEEGKAKDGWVWSTKNVRRVLYRLPKLKAASAEEIIWLVEGEKDVHTLERLGLLATTSPGGADKWQSELSEQLRDRHVVLLPDNDEPGRAHANRVLFSLRDRAASVKVLELPGLPEKGDVTDWVNAGGTAEELLRLVGEAGEGRKKIRPEDVTTIDDLIRAGAEIRWTWHGWIQTGVLTLVAAEPGTGKTRFVADLLRRIRYGLDWPDGQTMNMPSDTLALWVVADNNHDEIVTLSRAFGITESLRINSCKDDPYGGVMLDEPAELMDLEARIEAVRPALVVVDTVGNSTGKNLCRSEEARSYYQPLQIIARRHRVALLCNTHLNASGGALGRRVLEKVRVALYMDKPDSNDDRRKLWIQKSNSKYPLPLGVTMGDEGNEYDFTPPQASNGEPVASPDPQLQKAISWLSNRLKNGPEKVQVLRVQWEADGLATKTIYRAKDRLEIKEYKMQSYKWWELTNHDNDDKQPF